MRTSKKIVSLILAVMMISTMLVVGTVAASAAGTISNAQEFYAACWNGGTYELTNDITLDYWYNYFVCQDTTINGNGYTISADDSAYATSNMFKWYDNTHADLTLSNVTLDGKGIAQSAVDTQCPSSLVANNNDNDDCLVTMTNCTVKNFKGFSYVGAVYIFAYADGVFNNCTFTGNTSQDPTSPYEGADIWAGGGTTIAINGGTYGDSVYGNASGSVASTITVENGASVNEVALGATSQATATVVVDDSAVSTVSNEAGNNDNVTIQNGGAAVVQDFNGTVDTTKSSNVIMNEADLVAATAQGAGGNYVLGADITLTDPAWVNVYEDFNLNLGGYTITSADSVFVTKNGADLTVDNGTLVSTVDRDYAIYVNSGSVFTLGPDAKLEKNTRTGWCGAVIARSGSTTNVYGEIEAADYGIYTEGTAVANVYEGAKITSTDAAALSGNGSGGNEGYTMNVYGGELTSVNDVAIYHPNQGTLNVTGGTIKGATAVYIKSGTTNLGDGTSITGGTFIGNGAAAAYSPSGNGANPTGDAIVVDNCGYPGGAPNVAITGGTFTSDNAEAVASYAKTNYEPIKEIVSGGSFSSDVDALAADGFVGTKNADGTYGVKVDDNIANGKADIEGYQIKVVGSEESTGDTGNDINTKGLRILTKVDNDFLATCSDYGYVVAKVSGKDQATANFSLLTNDGGNAQKVISCKGTSNHGLKDIDNTYVTLAVNGMGDNDQVAARFYVVKDGTYYSYYVGSARYNGIIATMPASN